MEDWIKHQRALLELELAEEATLLSDRIASLSAKACENEGLSMVNLETVATRTELFGRCCVEFQKIGKVALPTCFKVGDEVTIISANTRGTISSSSSNKEADNEHESEMFGLIKSTSQFSIEVVIDEYDDRLIDFPLRLNLRPSMKTHTKMMEALAKIAQSAHPLLSMLYRPKESIFEQRMLINGNIKISQWYNNRLNESQKNAIETCLNATNVSIVHGPVSINLTISYYWCIYHLNSLFIFFIIIAWYRKDFNINGTAYASFGEKTEITGVCAFQYCSRHNTITFSRLLIFKQRRGQIKISSNFSKFS